MLTTILAGEAAPAANNNPYGVIPAIVDGGPITWSVFGILVIFLFFSLFILVIKLLDQQKVLNQTKRIGPAFWNAPSLRESAAKLEPNSAYRQIVDDGLAAQDQHGKLTDPVEAHEWVHNSLQRSEVQINNSLKTGLSFLATVGSTAPFVGLFGTVVGIIRALIKIGAAGQPSIDAVAGPVGEALIMTAIGLIVAVPAVLAYNWLQARNKKISEQLSAFSNDVLGYLASNGALRPVFKPTPTAPTAPKPATTTTAKPATSGSTAPRA